MLKGNTYFISDCHLSADRAETLQLFEQFIRSIHGADALFILGDLFDVWVGDDHETQASFLVQNALSELRKQGTQIFFLAGNRDFLVGKKFSKAVGWQVLPDYQTITHYNHTLLVCHGDTLCTDDVAYQKFRRFVRNPLILFFYRNLPLRYRTKIADKLRAQSKTYQSQVNPSITDVNENAVESSLKDFQVPTIIHGHTHRAKHHTMPFGERFVLGDWHPTSAVLLQLTAKGPCLIDYQGALDHGEQKKIKNCL